MKQGTRKILVSFLLILAMLSGLIPGAAMPAMAEELVLEEALPEQIEAAPAEELFIEEETPAEEILIEDDAAWDSPAPAQTNLLSDTQTYASPDEPGTSKPFVDTADLPVETNVNMLNGSNWMAGIAGDRYLNEFNIPYTHDSAMADYIYHWGASGGSLVGGGSYCKTQYHQIDDQLARGVRILDLRLNHTYEGKWTLGYSRKDDGYNLYLCHGKDWTGSGTYWARNRNGDYLTVHQVFYMIRDFLKDHPTETVIVGFDIERDDTARSAQFIAPRLKRILSQVFSKTNPSTGKSYLYTEPGLSSCFDAYTHMPQLKDCRGQVVLMPTTEYLKNIGGMDRFIVYDNDIMGGSNTCNATHKLEHLKLEMQYFNEPLPLPGQHLDMLRIIDTNSHAQQWDDFTFVAFDNMHPLAIAEKVHPAVFGEGKLLSQPGRYYGWVKMDGATESDCRYIYMTNFPDAYTESGTATITVTPGEADDPEYASYYASYYAKYETQTYVVPKGAGIVLPDDIYDVRSHTGDSNLIPYLDYWWCYKSAGGYTKHAPGEVITVTEDMTFTPIYNPNHGRKTTFHVVWQDCDNVDGLRPSELNIRCTYIDTNNQTAHETVRVYAKPDYQTLRSGGYIGSFTGDLRELRPDWSRVPIGTGVEQGVDSKEFYRYELEGDPAKDEYVIIRMIHTNVKNNAKSVTGAINWEDLDDADHIRPDSVTVRLLADGKDTGKSVVVTPRISTGDDDVQIVDWTWEIPNCMSYDDGREIVYTAMADSINGYRQSNNGTDIRCIHDVTQTKKRVAVIWDDDNDANQMRPDSVHVTLRARNPETDEWADVGETDISTGDRTTYRLIDDERMTVNYGDITLYGVDFANLSADDFMLAQYPVDGYSHKSDWAPEWNAYQVIDTWINVPKGSELYGVYQAGDRGDVINFGKGTYIQTANAETPVVLMEGNGELKWAGYSDGKHEFIIGDTHVFFEDDDGTQPWGLRVTGGKGTQEEPYIFEVIHQETVGYWEAGYENGMVTYTKKYCMDYTPVTESTKELKDGQWYVVDRDVTLEYRPIVTGNAHLILREGTTLNAMRGIGVSSNRNASLNIYTESNVGNGSAVLNATGAMSAAIGGWADGTYYDDQACGAIIVHNGILNLRLGYDDSLNAAIGSCDSSLSGGELTIYGGKVTAEAPRNIAIGIGVNVNVYGGILTAVGNGTKDAIQGGRITTANGITVYARLYSDDLLPEDAELSAATEDGDYVRSTAMTIREGHRHDFVYTCDYDTITATCNSEDCDLHTNPATLTIKAPEKTQYNDGKDPAATLENAPAFIQKTRQASADTVKYYVLRDEMYRPLDEAPTDAGEYMAVVGLQGVATDIQDNDGIARYTSGTVSAVAYYTIQKVPVKITEAPAKVSVSYGEELGKHDLHGGIVEPAIEGSFAWEVPDTVPTTVRREEYNIIFTPKDGKNYESATGKAAVTVNPGTPTMTAPTGLTLSFNGTEQELVTAGSAEHGVMMYALGESENAPTTDEAWQNSVPTHYRAGEYTVWYKVVGDENYFDLDPASVTTTITLEPQTPASSGFTLPAALVTIEEEAFAGIPVSRVEIPETVKTIGPRAFADCKNLREFVVPATVETIDDTALEGCTGVIVYGEIGSEADRFASDNGFMFAAWNDSWIEW